MNQIPNIEETNTREVEEIVEEFEKTWSDFIGDIEFGDAFKHLADDPDVPFVLPEMCKWIRTTLHQQLQKARTEGIDDAVERVYERKGLDDPECWHGKNWKDCEAEQCELRAINDTIKALQGK